MNKSIFRVNPLTRKEEKGKRLKEESSLYDALEIPEIEEKFFGEGIK